MLQRKNAQAPSGKLSFSNKKRHDLHQNKARILDFLRGKGKRTATEIARALGYANNGGIFNNMKDLVDTGLVVKTFDKCSLYEIANEEEVVKKTLSKCNLREAANFLKKTGRNYTLGDLATMLSEHELDEELISRIKSVITCAIPTIKKHLSYSSIDDVPEEVRKQIVMEFLERGSPKR